MDRSRPDLVAGCHRASRKAPGCRARLLVSALLVTVAVSANLAAVSSAGGAPNPPTILPGDEAMTSTRFGPDPIEEWIVVGRANGQSRAIAAVHRAKAISGPVGAWVIATYRATAFARDLDSSGLLLHAEPNLPATPASFPRDRLTDQQWWLPVILDLEKTNPPDVTRSSPTLALIERSTDPLHPDLAEARLQDANPTDSEADEHGTIVASIAGSPAEDKGISGVWPGMKMRLFDRGKTCSSATEAVFEAARKRLPVINMSYGFPPGKCKIHYQATEFAVHKGSLPIAAAGDTFLAGNGPMRPAIDPHVISVSAVDQFLQAADFATRNNAVDMTAPGVSLLAPSIKVSGERILRDHGPRSGTSFSAPMVSAAATWLRQARSNLSARQISRLLTSSTKDLGPKGWDRDHGTGILDIDAALKAAAPPDDPGEPNDDIAWINGTLLKDRGKRIVAPRIYRPGFEARELVKATISTRDDPVDVYRLRIGREATVIFRVDQLAGDVVVQTFEKNARGIGDRRASFGRYGDRRAPLPEGIRVVNRSRKARDFYMAIRPGRNQKGVYARYRITVQSIR